MKDSNALRVFNPNFFKRNPKLGYQFKVEFDIYGYDDDYSPFHLDHTHYVSRVLSTCVNSVTIPSIKGKNTPYVSDLLYNVVEYDYSDMTLRITFAENDDMIVNRFLMHLLSNQRANGYSSNTEDYIFLGNSYSNTFIENENGTEFVDFLDIKVFEMNPNKNSSTNYSSSIVHVFKNCYVIKSENVNMEYTDDPKGVTMDIEFGFLQYYIGNTHTQYNMKELENNIVKKAEGQREGLNKELSVMKSGSGKAFIQKMYDLAKSKNFIDSKITLEQFYSRGIENSANANDYAMAFADLKILRDIFEKRMTSVTQNYDGLGAKFSTGDIGSFYHNKIKLVYTDENGNKQEQIYDGIVEAYKDVVSKKLKDVEFVLANTRDGDISISLDSMKTGEGLSENAKKYLEKETHKTGSKVDLKVDVTKLGDYYKVDANIVTNGLRTTLDTKLFDKSSQFKGLTENESYNERDSYILYTDPDAVEILAKEQKTFLKSQGYTEDDIDELYALAMNVQSMDFNDKKINGNEIAYEIDLDKYNNSGIGKSSMSESGGITIGNYNPNEYYETGAWLDLGQHDATSMEVNQPNKFSKYVSEFRITYKDSEGNSKTKNVRIAYTTEDRNRVIKKFNEKNRVIKKQDNK